MDAADYPELDPPRRKLLEDKLGGLLTWSKPDIFESIGPFEPEPFETYDITRRELISNCIEQLNGFSDAQIEILTDTQQPDPEGIRTAWSSFKDQRITSQQKRKLPWYAGGFGHPEHTADFDHWAKMSHFSVEEILCLSIGIEPENFPAQKLMELQRRNPNEIWPALVFLLRRLEQLKRKFDPQSFKWRVQPSEFLKWTDAMDFEVAAGFLENLRSRHGGMPRAAPTGKTTDKPDKREVDSIAQLFTAMAIEYFGYDPSASKSPVTREITDLAASMGMALDEGTVRKYLQKGAAHIPMDWKPNSR